MLQQDSEIVAAVDNGEAVLEVLGAVSPNLIVPGVELNGPAGFEIARRLHQSKYPAKLIIISLHESRDPVRGALAVGASGYVFLCRLLDDLPAAIDVVIRGEIFEPK